MAESRTIEVKVLLTPSEFLAFKERCDAVGAARSTRIALLIRKDIADYLSEQHSNDLSASWSMSMPRDGQT